MVSRLLLSVDYLHSINCKHLLTLYVFSSTLCPLVFRVYPMALIISSLWCCGHLFYGRNRFGIMVGCDIVALSPWSPPSVDSRDCRLRSCYDAPASLCACGLSS